MCNACRRFPFWSLVILISGDLPSKKLHRVVTFDQTSSAHRSRLSLSFYSLKLCPQASEAICADVARSLVLEGRVTVRGLSKDRELERGKGWVILQPRFLFHDVLGGVLGVGYRGEAEKRGDGTMSAAKVCEAVIR